MVVLSAIGRFFKKIWDWIKQTAWIQPLLIVGIIFGVIFSIPSIVKAAKNSKSSSTKYNTYYHQFQKSLANESNSDADIFTTDLEEVISKNTKEASDKFRAKYPGLGDKFFLAYVAKDCDKCEDAKEGFATFQSKLNSNPYYKSLRDETEEFHFVTIFTDDENNETTSSESAFVKYLERHQDFFQDAGSVAYETPYFHKGHLNRSDLEALETADPDNFLTPTIFLVELKEKSEANEQPAAGVTEIMFGVDGSDKNAKAKTLLDCWNHTGEFSYEPNIEK